MLYYDQFCSYVIKLKYLYLHRCDYRKIVHAQFEPHESKDLSEDLFLKITVTSKSWGQFYKWLYLYLDLKVSLALWLKLCPYTKVTIFHASSTSYMRSKNIQLFYAPQQGKHLLHSYDCMELCEQAFIVS